MKAFDRFMNKDLMIWEICSLSRLQKDARIRRFTFKKMNSAYKAKNVAELQLASASKQLKV